MTQLEPVGHQLVIVTVVFGLVALATLSIRMAFRIRSRRYDASDTCLIAAMVCFSTNQPRHTLTVCTGMRHHSEHHSNHSRRSFRLWKSKSRHPSRLEIIHVAHKTGVHQPNRFQAHDTSVQAFTLFFVPEHVFHID